MVATVTSQVASLESQDVCFLIMAVATAFAVASATRFLS